MAGDDLSMSVSVLQPDNRILEALHPPMPRRQSCDRCHEQKVRCVTYGYDGVSGLGLMIEESEASLGKSVIAPVSCQRCGKAGAVCIYSPQLRSGRPRVHRSPPRRRIRKGSRCPSSSSSPSVSPTISHPLSPGLTTPGFPPRNIVTTNLEHQQPEIAPLVSSSARPPHYDHGRQTQSGPDAETPLMLVSHFGSDDNLFSTAIGSTTTFSQSPDLVTMTSMSLFSNDSQTSTPTTIQGAVDQQWLYSTPTESPTEEIAQINLRIHRAGRILSPLAMTVLSLSSPEVNEVFDATCSFISFVERNTVRQSSAPHTPVEYGAGSQTHHQSIGPTNISSQQGCESIALSNATDTSVCLMVFACHQLLLGIFEDLCNSLLLHVKELRLPSTQILVTVNFINHLLEQLDHAVGLLAAIAGYERVPNKMAPNTSISDYRSSNFISSGTNFSRRDLKSTGVMGQNHDPRLAEKSKGFSAVFDQADQRQSRVVQQVTGLKRLLEQTALL